MQRFRYKVELVVEVEAFDEDDADDCIEDTFGVGNDGGVDIKGMQIVDCQPA